MSDTSSSSSDVENADDEEENNQNDEEQNDDLLPIASHVNVIHGLKTVSSLTLDTNGIRMITGGHDETMKMFDFTSMDKNFQAFRTIQPCAGRLIRAIEYSANNDMILVIPGDCQAIVLNREASGKHVIFKSVLGDMYVTDMNRTKGHKSLLNYGCWNPSIDSQEFMTCADDCTIRLWSLNKRDEQLSVIRTKGESGRDVRTTTCTYNQSLYHNENSNLIAAGCENGSILVWDRRRSFVHVTFKCMNAHLQDESITSLKWSYDSQILASRSTDHTLKLWDIRKFNKCLSSHENIYNHFSMTNISFSPNDKFLITGVSKLVNSSDVEANGKLLIFDRNDLSKPVKEILFNDSVIRTAWHPKLNQIFTTTNNGLVRIFYDEKRSPMAGVRLCLNRKEKKSKNTNDFMANIDPIEIAYPSTSTEPAEEQRESYPQKQEAKTKSSSSLHYHLVQQIVQPKFHEKKEDPRVELLKHAEEAERNPKWVTPAYVHTQPKPIFQQQLDEEEQDEEDFSPIFKKQRKN